MKKKIVSIVLAATMTGALFSGCGADKRETEAEQIYNNKDIQEETDSKSETKESPEQEETVTIVYTNDVHSYVANVITNDEVTEDGLRYSKVAAMVDDMREEGKNVLLVDAGDQIQGCSYGAIDEGESIINLMNATGYDLATIGNHEFDYGANRLFQRVDQANYPYISCNFHNLEDSSTEDPFEDTYTFSFGETTVAFVGITTPDTISASTPTYFKDADGNFIYSIDGLEDVQDLYDSVQAAIDSVRNEADYVIALGHTGVGKSAQERGIASINIIENTTGLDAYIDGHSHTTMIGDQVKDRDGNEVLLTQTGSYLSAVGVLEISEDGEITSNLVTDYDREDEEVATVEATLIDKVQAELGKQIAVLDTSLYISNPDKSDERLIRSRSLNAGDFVADSIYWYFNDVKQMDCDLAIINGGGIRTGIEAGAVTMGNIKDVEPFGNMICLISATGQQILDAVEMGVIVVDKWDDEWDAPSEHGGFLHVAGMRYTVDTTIPSSVVTDDNELFVSVDGEYRVTDIEIYNKETGKYEPIELDRTYNIGGINYILRNSGSGLSMFSDCDLVIDYVGQDCDILAAYMESFKVEGNYPLVKSENSPLKAYDGYQIDYENPFGSGRINLQGLTRMY